MRDSININNSLLTIMKCNDKTYYYVGNQFLQYVSRDSNKDTDCIVKMIFDREKDIIIIIGKPPKDIRYFNLM